MFQISKTTRKKFIPRRGFMVVESLVMTAVIAASVLTASGVAQKSVHVSRQALHNAQAAYLLEEGAEAVRVVRDNGWSNISSLTAGTNYYPNFSGGTWSLSSTPSSVGIFTRTVVITAVNRDSLTGDIGSGADDSGSKLVTVTVSWSEGSTNISKTISFYIFDIFS